MGSVGYNSADKREGLLCDNDKAYPPELGFARVGSFDDGRSSRRLCSCGGAVGDRIAEAWGRCRDVAGKAWEMGRSDHRKVVFSAKMGLALMLISLLIFLKEPVRDLGQHYVWAILTVVVVFEFSIGATLSKGFNRGLGTLSAGGLALGMAELSEFAGKLEELFLIISIFIIGFLATYAKLYPKLKPYEYGFRVFLITYCYIMVSGYRTNEFVETAMSRFFLIALGASVGLAVNICIYPIWAGEDLHNLVVKNFMGVASSLEGCVRCYLDHFEYKRIPSKILTYQASDDPLYSGYRSAVESKSQEDALVGFAIWEPPHGPYKMLKYPWEDYVTVSGALRHCAFTVMALHGCMLSEIQAPHEKRRVFRSELQRVGIEGAKVLRELGNKVKRMEKLGPVDILDAVHDAAEELQKMIDRKSYLLVDSESWEIGKANKLTFEKPRDLLNMDDNEENNVLEVKSKSEAMLDLRSVPNLRRLNDQGHGDENRIYSTPSASGPSKMFKNSLSWNSRNSLILDVVPKVEEESATYRSAEALCLATFTSLLIEFVARLQFLVLAFEELSEKAKFKEPVEST